MTIALIVLGFIMFVLLVGVIEVNHLMKGWRWPGVIRFIVVMLASGLILWFGLVALFVLDHMQ